LVKGVVLIEVIHEDAAVSEAFLRLLEHLRQQMDFL